MWVTSYQSVRQEVNRSFLQLWFALNGSWYRKDGRSCGGGGNLSGKSSVINSRWNYQQWPTGKKLLTTFNCDCSTFLLLLTLFCFCCHVFWVAVVWGGKSLCTSRSVTSTCPSVWEPDSCCYHTAEGGRQVIHTDMCEEKKRSALRAGAHGADVAWRHGPLSRILMPVGDCWVRPISMWMG